MQYPQPKRNTMMKQMKSTWHLALTTIATCLITACSATALTVQNPYEGVQWESAEQYFANLHTHTTESDGKLAPAEVIDLYKDLGYHILAITDHNTKDW